MDCWRKGRFFEWSPNCFGQSIFTADLAIGAGEAQNLLVGRFDLVEGQSLYSGVQSMSDSRICDIWTSPHVVRCMNEMNFQEVDCKACIAASALLRTAKKSTSQESVEISASSCSTLDSINFVFSLWPSSYRAFFVLGDLKAGYTVDHHMLKTSEMTVLIGTIDKNVTSLAKAKWTSVTRRRRCFQEETHKFGVQ